MSKHFYAPVVVRTENSNGHDVIPAPEFIDRACKCQELRACPIRACIEFIGGKQDGGGSRLARGKRYLRKNCECSGVEVKMTYLVYYKRNSEFAEFYGLNVVKYSEAATAKILESIAEFLNANASDADLNRLFGLNNHVQGKKYVDELYAIQRGCLQWLRDKIIREKGPYVPNPAASLDKNIEAIDVTFQRNSTYK